MKVPLCLLLLTPSLAIAQAPWRLNPDGSTTIEAERPIQVTGRSGLEKREVASKGEVLGAGWGSKTGDFAELFFKTEETLEPARIRFRYARDLPGNAWVDLILDSVPVGRMQFASTGGDGSKAEDYRDISIGIPQLKKGYHRLYLTAVADGAPSAPLSQTRLAESTVLDRIGNRTDKNSVGHGKNLALYTGRGGRKRFFFATHELGNVFNLADGETLRWYPDHVLLEGNSSSPGADSRVFIDHITFEQVKDEPAPVRKPAEAMVIEQRQVCVTKDDVVVSQILLANKTGKPVTHEIELSGDCRKSFDWREKPGGEKSTVKRGDHVLLVDKGVFPNALPNGLCMAIGSSIVPTSYDLKEPGAYRMTLSVELKPGETSSLIAACAVARSEESATGKLEKVLAQRDPIATNRSDWEDFYTNQIPNFQCSDDGLTELYGFRWFLLRFSTAGGDLGFFKYPVVMEGRQAYQTYCCYSAPFMAFDMNWASDPMVGFGHIANMAHAAYEDGRFPWYTSPRTNEVKLDHKSRSGLSLLPHTAWRHYQIHGDKELLAQLYPAMKKNAEWWMADRDPNSDGLYDVSHQLETGQDDLFRWGHDNREMRYDAVDATSYAQMNLSATAAMAKVLGHETDAAAFGAAAEKSAGALNSILWNKDRSAWFDRHPKTKKLADDYLAITTFYPHFAGVGDADHLAVFKKHLFNPYEFALAHPVPALPKNHRDFGPTKFWEGPSWPAATSHVVEALATAAKQHDRSLLPNAAQLFRRAAANHLQPRADFYERYNPITGDGLSLFRDYMHSWWVDIYIRHVAGLTIGDDGSLSIDPLPLDLDWFSVSGVPFRGRKIEINWRKEDGLRVSVDRKEVVHQADFKPGDDPIAVRLNP